MGSDEPFLIAVRLRKCKITLVYIDMVNFERIIIMGNIWRVSNSTLFCHSEPVG